MTKIRSGAWVEAARTVGRVLLDMSLERGVRKSRTVQRLESVLDALDGGRVDPTGDDLVALFAGLHVVGVAEGRLREQAKIERMAAARRSPKRLEIANLLKRGKTIGQVALKVYGSPQKGERTVKRVRSEMVASGKLPSGSRRKRATPRLALVS